MIIETDVISICFFNLNLGIDNMICFCCKKEIPVNSIFCCYCGEKQKTLNPSIINHNKIDGNNNINNNILGNNYGPIVINNPQVENNCSMSRSSIKKLSIAGKTIKTKWISIISAIGLLADVISIFTNTFTDILNINYFLTLLFTLFFGVLGTTFVIGLLLIRSRFLLLPLGYSLESNRDGTVFITKITGKCNIHKCDGNLSLRQIKINKNHSEIIVQCNRNPSHKWKFDYSIFDDSDLK